MSERQPIETSSLVTDETENNLVIRDERTGEIIQDNGTRMLERDSYDRVIDGLRIGAEAAAHLTITDAEFADYWRRLMKTLDGLRRAAMNVSGLDLTMKFAETVEPRSAFMPWRKARDRLHEGIKQAAGGMRQLAGCHRGDMVYSRMANDLESMQAKIKASSTQRAKAATRRGKLWIPDNLH